MIDHSGWEITAYEKQVAGQRVRIQKARGCWRYLIFAPGQKKSHTVGARREEAEARRDAQRIAHTKQGEQQ